MKKISLSDLQPQDPHDTSLAPADADMTAEKLARAARAMQSNTNVPAISRVVLEGFVRFVEFLLITAIGFAVHFIYLERSQGYGAQYLIVMPLIGALSVLALQSWELYRISAFRKFPADIPRLVGAVTLVYGCALAFFFFLKLDAIYSRVFVLAWYAGSLAALASERALLALVVDRLIGSGRLARRTVLVGGGAAADTLLSQFAAQPQPDLQILGIFDDRTDARSPAVVAGFPKLGTVEDLIAFSRRTRIDLVIFTLPITAEARILQMLRKLWVLPIDIRLAAHMNKLHFRPHSYSYIGSVPLIDIFDKPIAGWDVILKYAFDKIVGSFCLILLAPIMALVALAIKLDSKGPVLFRQKRYGFNNEIVEVFKFRSMRTDMLDFNAAKLVTKGDPRVTRVGRFIRKTSLDELPQLFNVVFKGDLSLVGPRPHALHAKAAERQYDEVVDGYFARHRVKPGITGWAQIHGWRGETDTPDKIQGRVECDLYYIENWSILLDIYILVATPWALFKNRNVY
jgi:Undecaprenyl-phosphate glucose phosphotransferase